MIKLCGESLITPLSIIFNNCIQTGVFPREWKMGNIIPVHKKLSKQVVNNYRPISLLSIFSKLLEKIIFQNLYRHFHHNELLTPKQSGFRPGDSCVIISLFQLIMIFIKTSITVHLWKSEASF